MPYDVLEKQIKSLPLVYYNELVDYIDFLSKKAEKEKLSNITEEEALEKMRDVSISQVWEYLKDDTW